MSAPRGDDLTRAFFNAMDCCATCAGGVLARVIREEKAAAWDEGNAACCEPAYTHLNPHREGQR